MLWVILDREECLDDLLTAMIELEITGATVLDGVGLKRVLATDVPIFAGLIESLSGSRPYNKNIVSVVEDRETISALLTLLKEIGIDFTEPGTGRLFALPIGMSVSTESVWPMDDEQKASHGDGARG